MTIDAYDEPQIGAIKVKLAQQIKQQGDKKLFITQGYICRNARGEVDNLKRGGSDYSASLIAAAINASVCEIWTDIDGMHNNDPRVVKKTVAIEQMSFDHQNQPFASKARSHADDSINPKPSTNNSLTYGIQSDS